jgi:hypothetical protein
MDADAMGVGEYGTVPSLLIAAVAVAAIAYAVFTENKVVASLAQAGGLQEREAARDAIADASQKAKTGGKTTKEEKRSLRLHDKVLCV